MSTSLPVFPAIAFGPSSHICIERSTYLQLTRTHSSWHTYSNTPLKSHSGASCSLRRFSFLWIWIQSLISCICLLDISLGWMHGVISRSTTVWIAFTRHAICSICLRRVYDVGFCYLLAVCPILCRRVLGFGASVSPSRVEIVCRSSVRWWSGVRPLLRRWCQYPRRWQPPISLCIPHWSP